MQKKWYTKKYLLQRLRQWVKRHQKIPTTDEIEKDKTELSRTTYANYFGSWSKALKIAGFTPMCSGGQFGEKHGMWKGGKARDKEYVLTYMPEHPHKYNKVYVREHRLVMEKHIGRYLTKYEVVHHMNGIKDDNRLCNLKLFESDAKHKEFHRKQRLVKEIKNT